MELADLALSTPVRLDLSGPAPAVYWADLSAERFVEPFFDQTVGGRGARGPGRWSGLGSKRSSLWMTSRRLSRRA